MPELSIIVPIYNVEDYLEKCIISILNQTFSDFELILVNDGSPDHCDLIMEKYKKIDSRIINIFKPNGGVSSARNVGLKNAIGKYVGFVDPDDWIDPFMFEKMISAIKEKQADVVICAVNYVRQTGEIFSKGFEGSGEYSKEEMLKELLAMPNKIGSVAFNKVYIRSKIQTVRFMNDVKIGEDLLFCFDSLSCCNKGVKIGNILYNELERENSATRSKNELSCYFELLSKTLLILEEKIDNQYPNLENQFILKYIDFCFRYIPVMKRAGKYNKQQYRGHVKKVKSILISKTIKGYKNKYYSINRTASLLFHELVL